MTFKFYLDKDMSTWGLGVLVNRTVFVGRTHYDIGLMVGPFDLILQVTTR